MWGKYKVKARCWNCGHKFELRIPRGVRIEDYEKGVCNNCGCDDVEAIDVPQEVPIPKKKVRYEVKRKTPKQRHVWEDEEW